MVTINLGVASQLMEYAVFFFALGLLFEDVAEGKTFEK